MSRFIKFLNERYITSFKDDMYLYADDVYDMLVNAYAKIGGIKGINSKEDLISSSDLWKLVRRSNKIVACQIYSTKRGGRKAIAGATDGSSIGKHALYDIMKEDIKLKDRSAWAEVSGAIEHKMIQFGAIPIKAEDAQKIISDKQFISIDSDGYHYIRLIGGEPHKKMMIGNIKNLPIDSLEKSD